MEFLGLTFIWVACICQIFQGLCLFGCLCLLFWGTFPRSTVIWGSTLIRKSRVIVFLRLRNLPLYFQFSGIIYFLNLCLVHLFQTCYCVMFVFKTALPCCRNMNLNLIIRQQDRVNLSFSIIFLLFCYVAVHKKIR